VVKGPIARGSLGFNPVLVQQQGEISVLERGGESDPAAHS